MQTDYRKRVHRTAALRGGFVGESARRWAYNRAGLANGPTMDRISRRVLRASPPIEALPNIGRIHTDPWDDDARNGGGCQ